VTTFNVRTVKLQSGEQFRDTKKVALEALELGGQRYLPLPEEPEAVLTLSRLTSGLMLELEFEVRVVGPCVRCLADAGVSVAVHGQEYQATNAGEAEELQTPYLVRADCAGLCPVCGRDLNREPHVHEEKAADPRWAALAKLRDQL
jgi:uncharacterized protein